MTEDKPTIALPSIPRPEGEEWEQDPWGNWSRWEPLPPERMAARGPPVTFTRAEWLERFRPGGLPPPLFTPHSAKPAKRTFITFIPAEWTPAQEAFARMIAVLGGGVIAARDMRRDLLTGRLIGGVRWYTWEDGWEGFEQLRPPLWQAIRIYTRYASEWKKLEITPGLEFKGHSLNYYISRASLEQRYPLLEETYSASAPPAVAKPEPLTRLPTHVMKHDWIAITAEMSELQRIHNFATDADLAKATLQWCEDKFDYAPSDGEMRDAAKIVRATARKRPELLPKKRR